MRPWDCSWNHGTHGKSVRVGRPGHQFHNDSTSCTTLSSVCEVLNSNQEILGMWQLYSQMRQTLTVVRFPHSCCNFGNVTVVQTVRHIKYYLPWAHSGSLNYSQSQASLIHSYLKFFISSLWLMSFFFQCLSQCFISSLTFSLNHILKRTTPHNITSYLYSLLELFFMFTSFFF